MRKKKRRPNTETPIDARFHSLYDIEQNSGCWVWNYTRTSNNYGLLTINGEQVPAHRFAYQWFIGEISDGLFVCHSCDNPPCVNPSHLFLGTHSDNMRDASDKGRLKNGGREGAKNGRAKLTEDDVRAIRAASGTLHEIAEQFGVKHAIIGKIRTQKAWRHIR